MPSKKIVKPKSKSNVAGKRAISSSRFNWRIAAAIIVLIVAALGYLFVRLSQASGYDGYQRLAVVQRAREQLGQAEWSNQVLAFSEGNQENWCADFVSWVHWQAGIPFQGTAAKGRSSWRIPLVWKPVSGVPNLRDYFKFLGVWTEAETGYTPALGDVIIFAQAGNTALSHTGIVESYDNKSGLVTTIEGNADNKVSRRQYSRTDSRIDGYGRPSEKPISTSWTPKL